MVVKVRGKLVWFKVRGRGGGRERGRRRKEKSEGGMEREGVKKGVMGEVKED